MAGLLDFLFGQGGQGLLAGYGGPAYPNGGAGAVDPSQIPAMGGSQAMAQAGPMMQPQGAPDASGAASPQLPQMGAAGTLAMIAPRFGKPMLQQQMTQMALQGMMSQGMSFPEAMFTLQNPQIARDKFGVQSLGAGKTPGGYEGQIVNNGGRIGMAFPTANGQAPIDANARTVKPGETITDLSQPNIAASAQPGSQQTGSAQGNVLFQNANGLLDGKTVDFLARQLNAGDQSVLANLGRTAQGAQNIAAVRQRAVDLQNQSGTSPETASAKTAEYGGFKSGQNTLGTRLANVSLAVNEAQRLIPQALDASANAPRSQYLGLNKIIQAYQEHTGDPNVVKLGAALYGLTHVYARAVNPQGVAAEGDLNHAQQILDKALAKGQLAGGIQQLYQEMAALQGSPNDVRQEMRDHFTGQKGTGNTADALLQGKLAISQGAPREAVMKRLMEKGIDPNGL